MLYNPNLYKEPTLRDFGDFIESKNPAEHYTWSNSEGCACAQYSHTKGMKGARWMDRWNSSAKVWNTLNNIAKGGLSNKDHTFGELSARVKRELELIV